MGLDRVSLLTYDTEDGRYSRSLCSPGEHRTLLTYGYCVSSVFRIASAANNPGSLAADLNLDPSDFPALGGGAGGGIGANSTSNQPLLSSYATQASAGSIAANAAQQAFFSSQQQQQQNQQGLPNREFSADDFPALGGGNLSLDGLNGHSSLAARSVQEQASAAAALAHRQNLLGTMSAGAQNQARSLSNAAASTVFPQMGSGVSAGSAVADDAKRVRLVNLCRTARTGD